MMASRDWKQLYKLFGDFIAAHPEIVLTPSEISIPQAVRDEFYRRFDDVRRAVVSEHYSALLPGVEILSDNYVRMEREITGLLGLDGISVPMDLFTFLHNPKEGLIRLLYNRTFDLLQGKTTVETYETDSGNSLRTGAADLFRLGYELWAALAVIKLLDPDEAFLVDLDEEYKPCLTELKDISFGRQAHHPTMRIPEFVLHSRKIDTYVAVKMALAREIETFVVPFKPPVRPRKKTGDTSFALDSRVMLLSFMPTPDNIPIIADIYEQTLTSPDWMIEYITETELKDPDSLNQVKRHLDALRPRLGTCLVLINGSAETLKEEIPDNIHAVSVGFDQSKLQSVIDALPLQA
jgi:hypothetical protein